MAGAADNDPSGLSTYAIAGATNGYAMLWLIALSTPMVAVIAGMCARISIVTGHGLAATIRERFPRLLGIALAALVITANTINVGADLGGMSAAAHLVVGLPVDVYVIAFGTLVAITQVRLPYRAVAAVVKTLALALFAALLVAFAIVTAAHVHPNWLAVARGLTLPALRFDRAWLATTVAVLGTTITPYLFFWVSALVVEARKSDPHAVAPDPDRMRDAHADVNAGMIGANLAALAVMIVAAAAAASPGAHALAAMPDALAALRPLLGDATAIAFAIGMIGTGLLAVPALVDSSAFIAAETFGFRAGFGETPQRAGRFYAVILAGVAAGMLMNAFHVDALAALFWAAIGNGFAAVPLIAVIVALASDRRLMGPWRSSRLAIAWGWTTTAVMACAAAGLVFTH
jgi:NRAMP (natural resistance-associated macrophage protein)-like metal ion transporter